MQRQEKFGRVHFVLLALTLAFLGALAWMTARERADAPKDEYRVTTERSVSAEDAARDALPPAGPLDINTATAAELEELMGIGPVLAQAIVDYRAEHGAFASVDELLEVSGIGEAKLDGIRGEVTVKEGEP